MPRKKRIKLGTVNDHPLYLQYSSQEPEDEGDDDDYGDANLEEWERDTDQPDPPWLYTGIDKNIELEYTRKCAYNVYDNYPAVYSYYPADTRLTSILVEVLQAVKFRGKKRVRDILLCEESNYFGSYSPIIQLMLAWDTNQKGTKRANPASRKKGRQATVLSGVGRKKPDRRRSATRQERQRS